jgi:hypothetical protein
VPRKYPSNSTTEGALGQAARGGRKTAFEESGDAVPTGEPESETELSVREAIGIATALIVGLGLIAALAIWWS